MELAEISPGTLLSSIGKSRGSSSCSGAMACEDVSASAATLREELDHVQLELRRHITAYQTIQNKVRIIGTQMQTTPDHLKSMREELKRTEERIAELSAKQKKIVDRVRDTHKGRGEEKLSSKQQARRRLSSKAANSMVQLSKVMSPAQSASRSEQAAAVTNQNRGFSTGVSTLTINAVAGSAVPAVTEPSLHVPTSKEVDSIHSNSPVFTGNTDKHEVEAVNEDNHSTALEHENVVAHTTEHKLTGSSNKPHLLAKPLSLSPLPPITCQEEQQYSRLSESHLQAIEQYSLENQEETRAVEFMAALDLVTTETLGALKKKKLERKRRVKAHSFYSYQDGVAFQHRKDVYLQTISSHASSVKRPKRSAKESHSQQKSSRTASPAIAVKTRNDSRHEDYCAICSRSGELLLCDTCSLVYHLDCLGLHSVPEGIWSCPKCTSIATKNLSSNRIDNNGGLAAVQEFIKAKEAKSEEKAQLLKKNAVLQAQGASLTKEFQQLQKRMLKQSEENDHMKAQLENSKKTMQHISDLINYLRC